MVQVYRWYLFPRLVIIKITIKGSDHTPRESHLLRIFTGMFEKKESVDGIEVETVEIKKAKE